MQSHLSMGDRTTANFGRTGPTFPVDAPIIYLTC